MMMERSNDRKTGMPWKLYILLLVMAAVGAAGLLPSTPAIFSGVQQGSAVPLPLFMAAAFLQSFLLGAILAFLGLLLSGKTGLGAPVLEYWVYRGRDAAGGSVRAEVSLAGQSPGGLAPALGLWALVGLLVGAAVFGVDLLFLRVVEIEPAGAAIPGLSWWQGLLTSLYGGINEEIMMRLFCLNALLWLLNLVFRSSPSRAEWKVWTAVAASALLFGLGHLPAAGAMMGMSPLMVVRILVLNLIAGLAFGVLFWKRGLLAAMTAHFSADVLMHAVLPLVFPSLFGG